MGLSERRKGHNFERQVARRLREAMPGAEVKRGLQSQAGGVVPDIQCPVFWPECKIGKRPRIEAALRQAEEHCPRGRIAIAITKRDRCKELVTMRLDDFLDLVSEWWESRNRW